MGGGIILFKTWKNELIIGSKFTTV